jgi:RNA polymerase sigma-70 factor (ECF subfamily)
MSTTPQPPVRLDTRDRSEVAAEEALLMTRIAEGDRDAAVGELYDRYARRLYGLGLQLLGEAGMAEELVQDTFVRIWRNAHRFDPERGSARTFVFTLARRAAVDLLRRSASRPLAVLAGEELDTGSSDAAFEQLLYGLEVREALAALTPKHRQVLECYYDRDLTQEQVAIELDLPLGTVKSRTYHALRALRAELEERGLVD